MGFIVGGMLGFGLPSQIFQSSAQKAKPLIVEKKLPKIVDKNKNKIFDNLEKLLESKPDESSFNTIVLFEEALSDTLFGEVKGKIGHFSIKYQYPSISGIAVTLTKGQIIALSKMHGIKQIENDAKAEIFLDKANYWFGAQKARTDFGLDGNLDDLASYSENDIVIAVLDTGIDYNHLDLDGGKVIGQKCYCCSLLNPQGKCIKPCCPNGQEEGNDAMDDNGHGTHVSSIAAGEGEGNSNYKGVAPGAALVGVKVLGSDGSGYMSYINAGIQWVIDNKDTLGIEIMNMSIGAPGNSDGADSTSQLVNQATDAGIVVVVSAGNEGPGKYTIGSPAAAAKAITIGAMADVEPGNAAYFISCGDAPGYGFYLGCFSSRGPTADGRIKPDVSAPGVFIMAAEMGTTNGYTEKSGTSMSSPFVAGLVGLMLQADSNLTPVQVKAKIMDTALDWGPTGDDIDYGAGRLDAYEAIKSAGGYSGTNIATPKHQYLTGNLTGTGEADWYDINVTNISYPIAVTLVMPNWQPNTDPDFDLFLYDTDGTTELDRSISITRQETVGYQPNATGAYKLKVYSFSGSGNYFFDQSAGTALISIIANNTFDYGILPLGTNSTKSTIDLNKTPVIENTGNVDVDLDVKSSDAEGNGQNWELVASAAIATDKYCHQYSTNSGASWINFPSPAGAWASGIITNMAPSATANLDLQILMPTGSTDITEKSITVTILATESE